MLDQSNNPPQFAFIDGLRGIAILMVVFCHAFGDALSQHYVTYYFEQTRPLFLSGARGVQLFFMVSAFTLMHSSLVRFNKESKPILSFYLRRAFRILPMWWINAIVSGIYYSKSLKAIILTGTMAFGFLSFDESKTAFPGGWSIFVEECFYLFFPWIVLRLTKVKTAILFFIGLIVIQVSWLKYAADLGVRSTNNFINLFPLAHLPFFGTGILIYLLFKNEKTRAFLNVKKGWLIDGALIALTLTVSLTSVVTSIFHLALIFVGAFTPGSFVHYLAHRKWIINFGLRCYSIYLLHFALLDSMHPVKKYLMTALELESAHAELRALVWVPLVLVCVYSLSTITWKYIELPFIHLGKKLISRLNAQSLQRPLKISLNFLTPTANDISRR